MGQTTGIEWCDATWNPVRGCDPVSSGCKNCYAEKVGGRFCGPGQPYHGFVQIGKNGRSGPHWTGKVELIEKHLTDPLHWKKPQRIFVNSMSDLFHEGLPDEAIDRVFAVMALCPQHTFQVLTKRPKRMLKYFGGNQGTHRAVAIKEQACKIPNYSALCEAADYMPWPYRNVWLGISCEDQKTADERIPLLLQTPAAMRFVSYEPALGPVDFSRFIFPDVVEEGHELHWVIVGGESGPGARPFDIAWARNTVEQCKAYGVACFVKQLGSNPRSDEQERWPGDRRGFPEVKDRKGGDINEWPEDLRVRQFPEAR